MPAVGCKRQVELLDITVLLRVRRPRHQPWRSFPRGKRTRI